MIADRAGDHAHPFIWGKSPTGPAPPEDNTWARADQAKHGHSLQLAAGSWQLAASPAGPSDRGSALQPTGLNMLPAGTNKNNLTANKNIGNMSFNKQKFTSVKLHKYYSKESKAQILIHFFLLFKMAHSSHSLNS